MRTRDIIEIRVFGKDLREEENQVFLGEAKISHQGVYIEILEDIWVIHYR